MYSSSIGSNPPGGFQAPTASSSAGTSAAPSEQDAKTVALYSGKQPVYQEPNAPSVLGTPMESEIREQLITLSEKGKLFLQRCPNVTTLPPEHPNPHVASWLSVEFIAMEVRAPQLLDIFIERMRGHETSADTAARLYDASFKRNFESLIVQCEDATAEDTARLKTAVIIMARCLNEPEKYIPHGNARPTDLGDQGARISPPLHRDPERNSSSLEMHHSGRETIDEENDGPAKPLGIRAETAHNHPAEREGPFRRQ